MRKNTRNEGFTLVELMVVLAITAILASVAVFGITGYIDYSNFKKQNEYAQSIFVGTQNALTKYTQNGEISSITKTMNRYGKTIEADWLSGTAKDKFDAKYEGRIYTLTMNKDGTICGEDKNSPSSVALKKIFNKLTSPYVFDKAILENASVTLEFDPVGGMIYSVLYSDLQDGFVYGEASGSYVSISAREEEERKMIMLGYYGADTIADETSRDKVKPVVESVKLLNDDTLHLQFYLSEKYRKVATGDLTYHANFYSADQKKLLLSTSFSDLKSLYKSDGDKNTYNDLLTEVETIRYNVDGTAETAKNHTFVAYIDNEYQVHILLDAADLGATSAQDISAIANTYSMHRLDLETLFEAKENRNIYVSIRAGGDKYKLSAWKRSNVENMYFASEKTEFSNSLASKKYDIANARHLYNIRYMEFELASERETKIYNTVTYTQKKTFSWKDLFTGVVGSELFQMGQEISEATEQGVRTAFPSIPSLDKRSTFTSSTSRNKIQDYVLRSSETALGIFSYNRGTITNATLENIQVEGSSNTGTFCGVNTGTLENLTTIGGTVKGTTNVGGIVGKDGRGTDTTESIAYSKLKNDCDVLGFQYVGGIIGQLNSGREQSIEVSDCVNTGLVRGDIYKPDNPTQKISDDIDEVLVGNVISTSANHTDKANNMYNMFKVLNGAKYPDLNNYDKDVLTYLLTKNLVNGFSEYSGSTNNQVEAFMKDHVWVPCALIDPNGNIYSIDNPVKGQSLSVVLLSKQKKLTSIEGTNLSSLVFYNGDYYYHKHETNGSMNENSMSNNQDSISKLSDENNWFKLDYTPTGIRTAAANFSENAFARSQDKELTTLKNEPSYIGGIVGYANNEKNGTLTIKNCTNNQDVILETVTNLLDSNKRYEAGDKNNPAKGDMPLLGAYVGGIAGYAKNASITSSSSGGGFVIGSNFVGGITGYYENAKDVLNGLTNKANIIGKYYVGGVTGVNADYDGLDDNGFIIPKSNYDGKNSLTNCLSYGAVVTTGEFGGGITGYNSGSLTECSYDFYRNANLENLMTKYNGNYIGGIVGRNHGNLKAENQKVSNYVAGRNFVGGIVGFNGSSPNCKIEGYSYSGGYVIGENFVGGVAGANTGAGIFASSSLKSNPNLVRGSYFVGGVIGGNLMAASKDIKSSLVVDNFLGKVEAKAFVGGQIGFSALGSDGASMESLSEELAKELAKLIKEDKTSADALKAVEFLLDTKITGDSTKYTTTQTLALFGTGKGNNQNRLNTVSGEFYVGGVIGYNHRDTNLQISDVVSKIPVTATSSVEIQELDAPFNLNPYKINENKKYSYAGGIVGKCSLKMIIQNCSLIETGTVKTKATYTGGLVEVNEGKLIDCKAVSIGNSGTSYVGGLVGLNKKTGEIIECTMNGITVTGDNVVGGLAAENFANIDGKNRVVTGKVVGYGENIGGLIGYSHAGAIVKDVILEINVSGKGNNVGGAIGLSKSEVKNIRNEKPDYSVTGNSTVGGIIGVQDNDDVVCENLSNMAAVTANYGLAGGVIGNIKSKVNAETTTGKFFDLLKNSGSVMVLGTKGDSDSIAGGITGKLASHTNMLYCENTGSVSASTAGGLVGVNFGMVQEGCTVGGAAVITGEEYSGGAVGLNNLDSNIGNIKIQNVIITGSPSTVNAYIGGVAGRNSGQISNVKVIDVNLISKSSGVSMGGIAGYNEKILQGTNLIEDVTIKFSEYNLNFFGNVGGLAGVNVGSITSGSTLKNSEIYGSASNPQNSPEYNSNYDFETNGSIVYGTGGLVGVNGTSDAGVATGKIEGATIDGVTIRAIGGPNNIANLGGIAGVNGFGSSINNIKFTTNLTTVISTADQLKLSYDGPTADSSYAHIGGAVGYNYGSVEKIGKDRLAKYGNGDTKESETDRKNSADSSTKVSVYTPQGHIGGIVGYNRSSGEVGDCATGSLWKIAAYSHAQGNAAGGIIGYNTTEKTIKNCDNWATVSKLISNSDSVGGIIGRQETLSRATWLVDYCVNYGNIKGYIVGGIIGTIKNRGGIIQNCDNYASVENLDLTGDAGGTVGRVYVISSGEQLNITACKNLGQISSPSGKSAENATVGGIVGRLGHEVTGNKDPSFVISNCVNTGSIKGYGHKAGIVAKSDLPNFSLIMNYDINYGIPVSVEWGQREFSGILGTKLASSNTNNRLYDCYSVAGVGTDNNVKYPISSRDYIVIDKDNSNFYFTNKANITSAGDAGNALLLQGSKNVYSAKRVSNNANYFNDLKFGVSYEEFAIDNSNDLFIFGGTNNKRHQVFLNINESLVLYDQTAPPVPNVKVDYFYKIGEAILIEWWNVQRCTGIIEVTFKNPDGSINSEEIINVFDGRWEIPTEGRGGQTLDIKVWNVSRWGIPSSAPYTKTGIEVKHALAPPKVSFVLSDISKENAYKIYLDNAADYKGVAGGSVITIAQGVASNPLVWKINVDENGNYVPTVAKGIGKSHSFSVSALPNKEDSKYGLSKNVMLDALILTQQQYNGTALSSVINTGGTGLNLGFAGKTAETLSYSLGLKMQQTNMSLFYRNEFIATDKSSTGLGVPVVYSSGDMAVSSNYVNASTNNYAQLRLSNIPEDINAQLPDEEPKYENISVRSYPINDFSKTVHTGLDLGTFTSDELESLKVTNSGGLDPNGSSLITVKETAKGTAKTLKTGYILTKTAEDKYLLSFNALLVGNTAQTYTKQVNTFSNVTAGIKAEPAPVISVKVDDVKRTYSASWDTNENSDDVLYKGAAYNYRLIGTTKSGDEFELSSGEITNSKNGTNKISNDTTTWNYVMVTLHVTRVGTLNSDGVTTKTMPNVAIAVTETKLILPQISIPSVDNMDQNELVYEVSWSPIVGEEELAALDHYEITVKTKILNNESQIIDIIATYVTDAPPTGLIPTNLFVDFDNMVGLDASGKTVSGSAVGNSQASISVKAIAKSTQNIYTNASNGVERIFEIPQRLLVPAISNMQITTKDPALKAPLSITEFEDDGFTLVYKNTDTNYINKDVVGKYQITLAVRNKDAAGTLVKELYSKKQPLIMEGTRLGGEFTAVLNKLNGLRAEYSGCNLEISLRAVSENDISSRWSLAKIYSLPKIKVNAVDAATVLKSQTVDCDVYVNGSTIPEPVKMPATQDSLEWTHGQLAKGYTINLERIEKPENVEDAPIKAYIDNLSISFTQGSTVPEVYFLDSKNDTLTSQKGEKLDPTVKINGLATAYTYSLYTRKSVLLDKDGLPVNIEIQLKGWLMVTVISNKDKTVKSIEYQLVLPDAKLSEMDALGSAQQNSYFIETVSFLTNSEKINIMDSDITLLTRNGKDEPLAPLKDKDASGILYAKMMNYLALNREKIAQRPVTVSNRIIIHRPATPYVPSPAPNPTANPVPSPKPTIEPTVTPEPTVEPTIEPTVTPEPTVEPTIEPTVTPEPTVEPTIEPTVTPEPTVEPTIEPTVTPEPTVEPTIEPTVAPEPTVEPTIEPTVTPEPTVEPTIEPTVTPEPTVEPTIEPPAPTGSVSGN